MLESQAAQNRIRVMKFLKYCSEDDEEELTEEHIDYCIGSAQDICKFIEHIGKELGLTSSAQLGYLQAITDLIDFSQVQWIVGNSAREFSSIRGVHQ